MSKSSNKISYLFSAFPSFLALRILLIFVVKKALRLPVNFFYSQTGEDIILNNLLQKERGYYIDVGCNEPIEKSNTFGFYLEGWKGITIDANRELIRRHKQTRLLDTAICAAISNSVKEVVFYKSEANAVSTIAEDFYKDNKERWVYTDSEKVTTATLTSILDQYLPPDTGIDLLSIDVEGIDLEVLQGLDLTRYRPKLIVVESHDFSVEHKEKNSVFQLLSANGYVLCGFATMNIYFSDGKLFKID